MRQGATTAAMALALVMMAGGALAQVPKKVAVQARAWLIVTVDVDSVPVQAPLQPEKLDPEVAVAVNSITVSSR